MAVTYNHVLRAAAVRINGIAGSTSSALESAYVTSPLTATQLDSADFSKTPLTDTCLLVEEKLAHAIANTGGHPFRANLHAVTGSLAHKAALPTQSSGSKPIIGVWGSVYDSSDGRVCTEKPLEMISRRVENAGSFHLAAVYNYKIDGNRIYHTRTNVVIDCCAYSKTDQLTAIGTLTNNMLLPDVLEEAMVCGIVSMLVRDDAFMQQAQVYKSYFDQTLSWISQGLVSVPPKVVPGPTLTANAA